MVKVKPGAKVITIERAQNVLTIERVVELFSTAFEQTCTLKVIDKLVVNCLTRELTAAEVTAALEKQKRLSKAVPSDYGGKFKEQWKEWCRVWAHFARPSHPQDKGKVERRVQNLNGEFIGHRRGVS